MIREILLLLGIAILTGYIAGEICEKIKTPKVVGWILGGVFLGVSGVGFFTPNMLKMLDPINYLVLALIGFDIGGKLSSAMLRKLGKTIVTISLFEALGAFAMVTVAVAILTGKLWVGLIFGGLSCATAPAATVDVLREYNSSGPLTSTTFAVVGVDDALAIIIYAFAAGFAKILFIGGTFSLIGMAMEPFKEIFGALILGVALGIVFAYTTELVHDMQELLLLSFGVILFSCGLAEHFGLSYILASMALGAIVINLPFGDKRCFDVVNKAKLPLYILFFIFVGARLRVGLLAKIGVIGLFYIVFRTIGKGGGSWIAARISGALGYIRDETREIIEKYFWLCLFSQAGVAIGLSIEAMRTFARYGLAGEQFGATVITVIAGTTLVFQIIGPPCVRQAIFKAGEAGRSKREI